MVTTKQLAPALLGISTLLFFSGCGVQNSPSQPQPPTNHKEKTKESSTKNQEENINIKKTENLTKADIEKILFAKGFDSQEYYKTIVDNIEMVQFDIVNREVFESKSEKSCEKLQKKEQQNNCRDNFYISQANETKDVSFCEKISQKESRNFCKQNTIRELALEKGNPELCNSLENEYAKSDCKNSVYLESARKSGNSEICQKIEDEGLKSICEQEARFAKEEKEMEMNTQQEPPLENEENKIQDSEKPIPTETLEIQDMPNPVPTVE